MGRTPVVYTTWCTVWPRRQAQKVTHIYFAQAQTAVAGPGIRVTRGSQRTHPKYMRCERASNEVVECVCVRVVVAVVITVVVAAAVAAVAAVVIVVIVRERVHAVGAVGSVGAVRAVGVWLRASYLHASATTTAVQWK